MNSSCSNTDIVNTHTRLPCKSSHGDYTNIMHAYTSIIYTFKHIHAKAFDLHLK